jgi:hypothetical protein
VIRVAIGFVILTSLRNGFVGEYDSDFDRLAVYLLGSFVLLFALLPGPARPAVDRVVAR